VDCTEAQESKDCLWAESNDYLDINMSVFWILEATVIPKTRRVREVIDLSRMLELQSQKQVIESDFFEYRRILDEPEKLHLKLKKFALKKFSQEKGDKL
jgi:hypothetical protein